MRNRNDALVKDSKIVDVKGEDTGTAPGLQAYEVCGIEYLLRRLTDWGFSNLFSAGLLFAGLEPSLVVFALRELHPALTHI